MQPKPAPGASTAPPAHRRHRRDRRRLERTRACEPLEPRRLLAASLVADLNALPAKSTPSHFTRVGDELYFFATDAAGRELWKTDGTAAGTVRVVDLNPGPADAVDREDNAHEQAQPDEQIAELNGTVFFTAADGTTGGFELFKTDGTAAGTALVKDLNAPGGADRYGSLSPTGLTSIGDDLFFTATSDTYAGVWKTDGTEAGTVLLGTTGRIAYGRRSRPIAVGGLYYFAAYDAQHGWELWKSDGTPEGTGMVKDLRPTTDSVWDEFSAPGRFTNVNGTLYFVARTSPGGFDLWKTNGTEAGTVKIRRTADAQGLYDLNTGFSSAVIDGELYFPSDNGVSTDGLWKTDGTVEGTVEVRPSSLTGRMGAVQHVTAVGDRLYFVRSTFGRELWTSDGSPGGTVRVMADFPPALSTYEIAHLTAVGDRLYFTVSGGAPGSDQTRMLWTSDGTAAGTVRLAAVPIFSELSYPPFSIGSLDGAAFFSGEDGATGTELWRTDGTAGGTGLLKDLNPATGDVALSSTAARGGDLYYGVARASSYGAVVRTDGTEQGTVVLRPAAPGGYSSVSWMASAGHHVFFYSRDERYPEGLWRTDGTTAGTIFLSNLGLPANAADPLGATSAGGLLYFAVSKADGNELWRSDGTPAGTVMLRRLDGWAGGADVAGTVYFAANDGQSGVELWKTDGTPAGTSLVTEIIPGRTGHSSPADLTPLGGALVFTANDREFAPSRVRLWRSDGTAAGTAPLTAAEVTTSRGQKRIGTIGDTAYFAATDGTAANGAALWKTDGTPAGTSLVARLPAGFTQPDQFTAAAGILFFRALDRDSNAWLWRTDGTEAGTLPVRRFEAPLGQPIELVGEVGGLLLFAADGVGVGRELWKSDGTEAGTVPAADIFPGADGSYPQRFVRADDALYFTAIDPLHGRELWKYTPEPAVPTARVVGRHVFYNHSAFDGNDARADARDDGAVAADKRALVAAPGVGPGPGTFANVTSYARGINGVMIDVDGLPAGAEAPLSAADFDFGPAGRSMAASSVTLRRGAGVNGSDRITLAWADGTAVRNGWLRVTVKANERTGLAQSDVFWFGNLVGDTGDRSTAPRVGALDLAAVKRALGGAAAVHSPLDFNRDGRVNALDLAAARQGLGGVLAVLTDTDE